MGFLAQPYQFFISILLLLSMKPFHNDNSPYHQDSDHMLLEKIAASIAEIIGDGTVRVNSSALEKSHVLKDSGGTLLSLVVTNTNAADRFCFVFDKASAPTAVDKPIFFFKVAAGTTEAFSIPTRFSSGISVGNSTTTGPTYTEGSADNWFLANVV